MIKFENTKVMGWEHAIRGMRNQMNVTEDIESGPTCTGRCGDDMNCPTCDQVGYYIGPKDYRVLKRIAGDPHYTNYRRMITVYVDITAPLYWWKEFDAYKVGTVANSCSTMHKIADKEFTLEDFSYEHLINDNALFVHNKEDFRCINNLQFLMWTIDFLNENRRLYIETSDELKKAQESYIVDVPDAEEKALKIRELQKTKKTYWWQMIQLLPSSYNQKRTIMLNYEELAEFYSVAENSDPDEWKEFGKWIDKCLPYSEFITMKEPEQPVWGASSL